MAQTGADLTAFSRPESASAALHARAVKVMPGGNTRTTVHRNPFPPYAVAGRGAVVVDAEGQERIDFLNNYTALIHGHADLAIAAAVAEQARLGASFGLPTPLEVDLAEVLVERVRSVEQVRFTNSGTEAVMMAIQAARAFTGRPMIARFEGAYHGSYDFAAVGTSPSPAPDASGLGGHAAYAVGAPAAVAEQVVVARYNDVSGVTRALTSHKDRLAAVLVDLMPWRMGLVAAEPDFVHTLRELTTAHGILLIVDEVITLRLAPGGAQSLYGIAPDLTTMGKIIGGGLPVGAVGGRADVMAVFDPRSGQPKVPHGGTFTANPITMAAGLATLRNLQPADLDRLSEAGAYVRTGLKDALAQTGVPGYVTGAGSLFGLCLGERPASSFRDWLGGGRERVWRQQVHADLLARGVVVAPHLAGCLSTPMTVADLDVLIAQVGSALADLRREFGAH